MWVSAEHIKMELEDLILGRPQQSLIAFKLSMFYQLSELEIRNTCETDLFFKLKTKYEYSKTTLSFYSGLKSFLMPTMMDVNMKLLRLAAGSRSGRGHARVACRCARPRRRRSRACDARRLRMSHTTRHTVRPLSLTST